MDIALKRIYETASGDDGYRVLVDKVWPRGISKEKARLNDWWKILSPSTELRKWFNHETAKWTEFQEKYRVELNNQQDKARELLSKIDLRKRLTLLYAAKDEKHNHALVLKAFLEDLQD